MTRTTATRDQALANAFDDLECLIHMAKERSNVVWVLAQLTIGNTGHKLSAEEAAAVIRAIEDADEANAQLLESWTGHYERTALSETSH